MDGGLFVVAGGLFVVARGLLSSCGVLVPEHASSVVVARSLSSCGACHNY